MKVSLKNVRKTSIPFDSQSLQDPHECSDISTLRDLAKLGLFRCCETCPRNPNRGSRIFGEGCPKHQTINPIILFILRDPPVPRKGIVSCETTGRVCAWCHTDPSAKIFRRELYPILERECGKLMKIRKKVGKYPIYCINAVLHAPHYPSSIPVLAKKACSRILRAYIRLLKPTLIMVLGIDAVEVVRYAFSLPHFKGWKTPFNKNGLAFWWCYHHSPRVFFKNKEEIKQRFKIAGEFLKNIL
jgi:uracil-DNA glycosylase